MNKIRLILCILGLSVQLYAQTPEKVYSIVRADYDYVWYEQQAKAWKNVLAQNNRNQMAWVNYYTANRMAMLLDETKWKEQQNGFFQPLDEIVHQAQKHISNTFELYYMETYNDGDPSSKEHDEALMKAQKIRPFDNLLLSHLMNYYQIHRDLVGTETVSKKWLESNEMPAGILYTAYNQLMSLEQNAILFVNGDNDTYPNWLLQYAKNIRKDVLILNVSLLLIDNYRDKLFEENNIPPLSSNDLNFESAKLISHVINSVKDRPIYVSAFLATDFYEQYTDKMYLVGLAFKYSEQSFNNIAVLRNNFENKFLIDYLKMDFSNQAGQGIVNKIKLGYVALLLKLYENYQLSGEVQKAADIKNLAKTISQLYTDKDWMSYFEK